MKNHSPIVAMLLSAACGQGLDAADAASDLSASTDSFVSIQRDERKCAAPACGGYWYRAPGSLAPPQYAAALDLSASGLDAAAQGKLLNAPAEELLLKAKAGAADKSGLRKLVVSEAWRGMPGIVPGAGEQLFSMPTPGAATSVATGRASAVKAVSVARASSGFVDAEWLKSRIQGHGAIVAAKLSASVLDASQVWLRLPETKGPCAVPREQACGANQTQGFARTPDRCLAAVGCVNRSICPMFQPACAAGYTQTSWTNASGCTAAACDPSWVLE
jgi:hypothetical protein